ncbi:hypothetical protein Q9G87_15615 [Nonomuraea sp. G32]|nr:hypothetical protein [Nonomuraea sp. G32]MDP4503400.1 hypothetical protein [Nonomuraea sp. G32]
MPFTVSTRELVAAAVALVEDQVNDGENRIEPLAEQVARWNPRRDPRCFDLALGPHQPLRHRALRYEEGAGDLVGGEPAEGPQGERHLLLDRERRMTAGEDELQALVGKVVAFICTSAALPAASRPDLAARACSRRMRSVARFRAVVISQARGLPGMPSRDHRSAAIAKASCAASSARSKSPRKPIRVASTRPHRSRKT